MLGIVIASLIMIPLSIYYITLALITGALTYLIVKDFTPRGKEGNLNMYIAGVILYSLTIIISRILF